MDRERFDALTRLFGSKRSRRGALGAMLGGALIGNRSQTLAASNKAKGKGHSNDHGKGHGQGHENDELCQQLACEKLPVPDGEKPEFCCKGGFCSCGGRCCAEEHCFQSGEVSRPNSVFCCTGRKLVVCCKDGDCDSDDATCCEGGCDACDAPGASGIAGSYRRIRR